MRDDPIVVLGLETSCDETGIALYSSQDGLLAHSLHSQVALHETYGGVVPELASRDHVRRLLPLLREVLGIAGIIKPDGVAYTSGPGLIGALLVGAAIGRSLAMAWNVPAVGVHHLEGHLLTPMLELNPPAFPFLALLVSGGHTLLVDVEGIGRYRILGQSLDDAVGEAFDKTAKLLGLPYPGGPELSKLAERGNSKRFRFPRPMTDRPGFDFSFSGLKTYALNTFANLSGNFQDRADVARAFEEAAVDTLLLKCRRAIRENAYQRLVVAGGVSANQRLRNRFISMGDTLNIEIYFPRRQFCTDNGAMIAYAGCQRLLAGQSDSLSIQVRSRWPLDELPAAS